MSFRIENKYIINTSKILAFKNWLNEKNFQIKFPKRKITSIYLDNKNLISYNESIEGIVPRKKIRIRYYGQINKNTEYYLEEKISSVEGRFKKTKKINHEKKKEILRYGFTDRIYGNCKFKKIITYDRSYFYYDKYRLTFDENIKFKNSLNSMIWQKINKNVFEIKTNINISENKLNHFIPFEKIRFSKYCETF